MRLAKKIFLRVFWLFFVIIGLDIIAQYYFYEFAYPNYKQRQIYEVVEMIREETPNFDFYSIPYLQFIDRVSQDHMIECNHYSSDTKQLNVELLEKDIIHFETREDENVKTFYYYTTITFSNGEQLVIEVNYSLQVLGEMLTIFTNYYIFIVIILAILVLLFTIWLTEQLTKPLLYMKRVTEHIANIDFSEKCDIDSNDELQDLATNINMMSDNLHTTLSQLQIMNERLQDDIAREREFEQMRSNFFATISHELKTPLTIIKGISNRIKTRSLSDEQVQTQLTSIIEEVDRMSSLVQDTLHYMKTENQTIDSLDLSSFNITMLVEHLNKRMQTMVSEKALSVHLQLEDIYVEADSDQIMTVMLNLYSNAIRYTPVNEDIYITISRKDEKALIEIENTGATIPKDEMSKIWEPFYRLEKSRNRDCGGTGLGLLIVSQILKLHKTEYGVINTKRGVKFYFELNVDTDFDE